MPNFQPLPITVAGNIFQIDSAHFADDVPANQQSFTIEVTNHSGLWVDVNVDRGDGVIGTGHIGNGDGGGFTEAIQLYLNKNNKITRWRPGVFGVPGNGGGEIHFEVPKNASMVLIRLTVNG